MGSGRIKLAHCRALVAHELAKLTASYMLRHSVSNSLVYIITPCCRPTWIDGKALFKSFQSNAHIYVFKLFALLSSYLPSARIYVFNSHTLI